MGGLRAASASLKSAQTVRVAMRDRGSLVPCSSVGPTVMSEGLRLWRFVVNGTRAGSERAID